MQQPGPNPMIDLPVAGRGCVAGGTQSAAAVGRLAGVGDVRLVLAARRATISFVPRRLGPGAPGPAGPRDIAAVKARPAHSAVLRGGDGINRVPALGPAGVGGAPGTADVALLRDDGEMLPLALASGRRAARSIRPNLAFTALDNLVGLSLTATGLLRPGWVTQSLPHVAPTSNLARLLRPPRAS